ncbi:MAG TPA: YciI family protein [bacterium]|nr:YciI family protein [bacterium]
MKFIMMVIPKGYETAKPGTMPDPKLVEKMMKYNESLQKAGIVLDMNGLHPPSTATRVSFSGGKPKLIDGPFAEAKETVGGYWIIQVKSKAEAVEWASRAPMLDGDMIEVRKIQEMEDFTPEVQAAAKMNP